MKAEHISIAITLEQIPNVSRATAKLLREAGVLNPLDLHEEDPYMLYDKICQLTHRTHDFQLIDVLMSAIDFAGGKSPRHWSQYTNARNQLIASRGSTPKE